MDLQSFLYANAATSAFLTTTFQATFQRITGQPGVAGLRARVQTILDAILVDSFDNVDDTRHILLVNAPWLPANATPAEAFAYLDQTLGPSAFDFITLSVQRQADVAFFTAVANSAQFPIPPFAIPLSAFRDVRVATTTSDAMLFHHDAAALYHVVCCCCTSCYGSQL